MIPIWTCRRCWTPTRSLRHKNKNKHWRGWGDVILWAPAINHAKRKQLTMNSNVFSSSSKRLRKPILPLINNQKQPPTMRNIGMKGCLGQSYRCIDPIESNVFYSTKSCSYLIHVRYHGWFVDCSCLPTIIITIGIEQTTITRSVHGTEIQDHSDTKVKVNLMTIIQTQGTCTLIRGSLFCCLTQGGRGNEVPPLSQVEASRLPLYY